MSEEPPYSRTDNFVPVAKPDSAGRELTPGTTVSDRPVDEVNYKVGATVIAFALTGLGVFLFNALGPLWMLAGGAGGAAVAWGAHRVKTGAADARWRRRMGIGRSRRRREGTLGRAVRAHTARTPKAGKASRVKMPARAAARTPASTRRAPGAAGKPHTSRVAAVRTALAERFARKRAPAAKAPVKAPTTGSRRASHRAGGDPQRGKLRQRLARHAPQLPRAPQLTARERKLARTRLDTVRQARTGRRNPARRSIGSAANHLANGQWVRALLAAFAAVCQALVYVLIGPDGWKPRAPEAAAPAAPKRRPKGAPATPEKTKGDFYDTDQDSDRETHGRPTQAQRDKAGQNVKIPATDYDVHPVMEQVLDAHAGMFTAVPSSVPNMIDHLLGLGSLYAEWAHQIDVCRSFLVERYPVHEIVHELMAAMADQMIVNHDLALQCNVAYQAANPCDVERNLEPRVNEEWNNVPPGEESGTDMAPLRAAVHEAMTQVFGYQPLSPPDLRAWLRGMLPLFWQLGAQVEMAYMRGGFPGAAHDIAEFWEALAQGYESTGSKADLVADGYEEEAAHVLGRFDTPRVNEPLANYQPTT